MPLQVGRKLDHYEIVEPIGKGGMGEVYRARDRKLGRDVAIKLLPDVLAQRNDRLSRFEREARLLATLNHPRIAMIHEMRQVEGLHFLVLEFVPGETLEERIKTGRVAGEALTLFSQIAEGLGAAHGHDIVHRDLKPSNVMVLPTGYVKLLDFGLATAIDVLTGGEGHESTPMKISESSVPLGTLPYMSPEQVRASEVDKRTDIWAFGCCLFEALAGAHPFSSPTIEGTVLAIIESEPDWESLPPATPRPIRSLLRRCLRKNVDERPASIDEARSVIESCLRSSGDSKHSTLELKGRPQRRSLRSVLLAAVGLVLMLFAGLLIVGRDAPRVQPNGDGTTAFALEMNRPGHPPVIRSALAISSTGDQLAYVLIDRGVGRLYIRSMARLDPVVVPGSKGALSPFFSPDGRWVGFFAGGKLKRAPVDGGAPTTICSVSGVIFGASWSSDGFIVFSTASSGGLMRVSEDGGAPETLTELDAERSESVHAWPHILDDSDMVLYTAGTQDLRSFGEASIFSFSLKSGERKKIMDGGTHARVSPTGHLVFARGGRLFAAPFDLNRSTTTGESKAVVDGVRMSNRSGVAHFELSSNGTLAYLPGSADAKAKLVTVDRLGASRPLPTEPRAFSEMDLSPDGTRLAVSIGWASRDIWEYNFETRTLARLTAKGDNEYPLWTPDGEMVSFFSRRTDAAHILWKSPTSAAQAVPVWEMSERGHPVAGIGSWSPDGANLTYTVLTKTFRDIWLLARSEGSVTRPLVASRFDESWSAISPDASWVAYRSDETGSHEIFVTSFPDGVMKRQVSSGGGTRPIWNPRGGEIFYQSMNYISSERQTRALMHVTVDSDGVGVLDVSEPRALFEHTFLLPYDVFPSGNEFVMLEEEPTDFGATVHVVLNWSAMLAVADDPAR